MTSLLLGDRTDVPLWFSVPCQFVEIDPTEDIERRVERTARNATRIPGSTPKWQAQAALAYEALIKGLADINTAYAAILACRSENPPERIISALFTVTVRRLAEAEGQTMASIAHGLKEPGGGSETVLLNYPAGQAIAHGQQNLVSWRNQQQSIRQAHVIFRLPDNQTLATLGISSRDLDDWRDLVGILDDICHTVSFTDPTELPTGVGAVLDGGL